MCISSLYINEKQIFVGQNDDLPRFILGHDGLVCDAEKVKTPWITIQNDTITASQCNKSTWTRNNLNNNDLSESCWDECDRKGGKCHVCDIDGNEGFCCKKDFMSHNGNCPDQAIMASSNSSYACVHGKFLKKSCRPVSDMVLRAKILHTNSIR